MIAREAGRRAGGTAACEARGALQNRGTSALHLLHYWWPVALGWSLTVVVQRATGRAPEPHGLAALLAGIVAAYSLDRVFDPPHTARPAWVSGLLIVSGLAAAGCCAWHTCHMPLRSAVLVPLLGSAALAYPLLKRVPSTKTVALPLVWTWAAIALPFGDGSWFGWRAALEPVASPLFCLIASGCLLCDLKDERDDRAAGVRSLPAMLGGPATLQIAMLLIAAATALALLEHRPGIALSAVALGLAASWPAVLATEAAGPLLVDVILTLPGILITARLV